MRRASTPFVKMAELPLDGLSLETRLWSCVVMEPVMKLVMKLVMEVLTERDLVNRRTATWKLPKLIDLTE